MLYFYLSARIYNIYFWKYENEIDWAGGISSTLAISQA